MQQSQQFEKQQIIEKLSKDYQDWFKQNKLMDETKLQQIWLEKKKKGILQSSNINFVCSISQQKVQFPVVFTFCVDQKTNDLPHFDEYCDLTYLIDFITSDSGKLKSPINCPICKKKKDLPVGQKADIDILKEIIRPHLFIFNLRKQVGILPKEIMYNYKQDKIFPIYKGKYQQYWNQIEPIFEVEMKKDSQFFAIAEKLQDYQGSEFTNICLLSQIRVNIPVRGSKCVHYEAYDLAALYKYLSEKAEQQKMKCVLNYCESIFDLKDLNCFCIDFDLLKASMEGLSFSMNFIYIPNFRILSESLLNKQRDEQILFYRQIEDNERNFLYLHKIYEMSETIFANESNKSTTEKFYENFTQSNLSANYNLFQCEITKLGIQIPTRCKNCKDLKICDLRFFACILHQVKNKEDLDGVSQLRMECPLCQSKFVEKPKPPQTFFSQIYIDTEMMKFFLQTPFYGRSVERFLKFTKQKPIQLSDIKINKFKEQLLNLKEKISEYTQGVSMYKLTLSCILSGKKLNIPVRHNKCNHYDCFDRDSLILCVEKNPDLENYKCPICNQIFGSVDNLFIDEDLNSILQKYSTVMDTWQKGVVNTYSKTIQQI